MSQNDVMKEFFKKRAMRNTIVKHGYRSLYNSIRKPPWVVAHFVYLRKNLEMLCRKISTYAQQNFIYVFDLFFLC